MLFRVVELCVPDDLGFEYAARLLYYAFIHTYLGTYVRYGQLSPRLHSIYPQPLTKRGVEVERFRAFKLARASERTGKHPKVGTKDVVTANPRRKQIL